jgi:hypothetical protein
MRTLVRFVVPASTSNEASEIGDAYMPPNAWTRTLPQAFRRLVGVPPYRQTACCRCTVLDLQRFPSMERTGIEPVTSGLQSR